MKISTKRIFLPRPAFAAGFTLPEVVIALTIFSLVTLSTIAVQIYAMRVYTLAATKLTATEQARAAVNNLRDKVRGCRTVYVGNYTLATGNPVIDFKPMTNGDLQQGNALMIYPTLSTNTFTLAFLQPGNGTNFTTSVLGNTNSLIVMTYTNGSLQRQYDVADYITNQIIFFAENFQGSVLSTNQNNYIIQMTMNFSQWEYPVAFIGTNSFNAYDYYRLQTRMTRRDID
jgi:prepilin-type N-terminal cleavage/methylation domain-containing protein